MGSPCFLILHLKRFLFSNGRSYKLKKYIGYDLKMTMPSHLLFDKKRMNVQNKNKKKSRYELRSLLVHRGDFVTHGHYLSYCRREEEANKNSKHQWLLFDDDKVSGPIDKNTVRQQQAYCLLYQKII